MKYKQTNLHDECILERGGEIEKAVDIWTELILQYNDLPNLKYTLLLSFIQMLSIYLKFFWWANFLKLKWLWEICPNSEFFRSVYSRIWTECRDLLSRSSSLLRTWNNMDQKKPCIPIFFTQGIITNAYKSLKLVRFQNLYWPKSFFLKQKSSSTYISFKYFILAILHNIASNKTQNAMRQRTQEWTK